MNAWNNLGVFYGCTGREAEAAKAWEEAQKLEPGNTAIRQYLERLKSAQ